MIKFCRLFRSPAPAARGALLSVCALLTAVQFGCSPAKPGASAPAHQPVELTGITVGDETGGLHNLDSLRGEKTVLYLFGAWCMVCKDDMRYLAAYQPVLESRGYRIVPIAIDKSPEAVRSVRTKVAVSFPLYADVQGELRDAFPALSVPTLVLLDRDGRFATVSTKTGARLQTPLAWPIPWSDLVFP